MISKVVTQFGPSGSTNSTSRVATVDETIQDAVVELQKKGMIVLSFDVTTRRLSHTRWKNSKRRVVYSQMKGNSVHRIITVARNNGVPVTLGFRFTHLGAQLGSMTGRLDAISLSVQTPPIGTSCAQSQG